MAYNPVEVGDGTDQRQEKETENVEMLSAMMGGEIDQEVARRLLRRCNGDVQKAATALLEGTADAMLNESAKGIGSAASAYMDEPSQGQTGHPGTPMDTSVIDLTGDDDELNRALNLSMETHNNETKFRASNRAPDPAWAMVRSNEPTSGMTQDDQSLSRAIEASYSDFANVNDDEPPPLEHTIREGNRPVVLRTKSPMLAYAALVLQALFFVPQVRTSIAKLSLALPDKQDVNERPIWSLIEIYAHMDIGALGAMLGDDILCGFEAKPCNMPSDLPGDLSAGFLRQVAVIIDEYVKKLPENQQTISRLFNFRHGSMVVSPTAPSGIGRSSGETCIVMVDTSASRPVPNNLMDRLSADLSEYVDGESRHELIFEPSQVVAFNLKQGGPPFSTSSPEPFMYPKSIYMDQFLSENLALANGKRAQQQQIRERIQELASRRQSITKSNGSDGLQALRAAIHYYEHIADAKGSAERKANLERTLHKLKIILASIEKEIESIDGETTRLKGAEAALFDCPELQNHKYDLRAVFMHKGIPGRKQIYLYVQHGGGWWKMVDTEVTQVEEYVVLTDTTGLHLGAGPYMLIYSRSVPQDQPPLVWSREVEEELRFHNEQFRNSISPEMAKQRTPDAASKGQGSGVEDSNGDVEMKTVARANSVANVPPKSAC